MATRRSVETCLVCMPDPCVCGKPASRTKVESKKLVAPAVPVASQPVQQPVERFDPTVDVIQSQRRMGISGIPRQQTSEDDLQTRVALTVLCRSGLIHPDSIEEVKSELNMTVPDIDALIWRQKRLRWQS